MMTTTSVTFGGLTFINGRSPEPDGSEWVLSGIAGWGGGASVEASRNRRPQAHGEFAERAWRGAGVVTVDGWVSCPDRATAASAKRRLAAAMADGLFAELTVDDEDEGVLSASVRLAATPSIEWLVPTALKVQFQLYQADPLRYGTPISASTLFPTLRGGLEYDLYTDGAGADLGYLEYGEASDTGRLVLSNTGTAAVPVTFQVEGPVDASGFEIVQVDSDRRLRFTGPVSATSTLVLDGATGNVLMDGDADRGGLLTFRDWPLVPAGGSMEFAFIPLGVTSAARLTAVIRPGSW